MAMRPESPLREVLFYFFRLGCIAFGGPAAHIALMRRELVQQKEGASDQEVVDMLGGTNLIPGPNSAELTMHLGAQRAGWRGLWLAGLAFIIPAVVIVTALGWAYVEYGDTPAGEGIILGITPFILAVIIQAIWGLRTAAFKGVETLLVGLAVVALALAGVSEIPLIFGAGIFLALLAFGLRKATGETTATLGPLPGRRRGGITKRKAFLPFIPAGGPWSGMLAAAPATYSLLELFLTFLKIGAVLYGSGYVLLSFMETEFVTNRQWLTEQQLVDAIAAGQFTPGPVFSTAAFAGYIIDGLPGALAASAGIFLPPFIFVTLTHPLVPRLRRSTWAAPFLDGVNVAALALMMVVTFRLAGQVLDGWYTITLFFIGAAILIRFNPNSAWLVLAGIAAGLLHAAFT
ncbi:MAG TPA: chromate efflux transporter [Tepidiformaceae bacterium]|nr:chromate efflux transporter [Tepidiformaceae bacterium]